MNRHRKLPADRASFASLAGWVVVLSLVCSSAVSAQTQRVQDGLEVFFDFRDGHGDLVKDRSGGGDPVDLKIANPKAVRRSEGALEIREKTAIRSVKPANRLADALKKSGEATIEVWIQPANAKQDGPARIVTFSKDSNERNFTVGQEGNRFEVRFRTTKTSRNGQPTVESPSKSLKTELTHVVYTRDRSGKARLFLNGKPAGERTVTGDLSNWSAYHLALGDEMTGSRSWLGTYHLVAIYRRALSPEEVTRNFKAGAGGTQPQPPAEKLTEAKPAPAPAKPQPKNPAPKPETKPVEAIAINARGLEVFYDFSAATGDLIKDRSGHRDPIDLKIEDSGAVKRSAGSIEIRGKTRIRSEKPATRLTEAVKKSGEFAVEAWLEPADTKQEGPARIVTLSRDTSQRNFTLGQEGDRFDVRFRTSRTDNNGSPSLSSPNKSLSTKLTHLVYTRGRSGRARIYLDGRQTGDREVSGNLSPWDGSFHLGLGNEHSKDRPWLGSFQRVAIYSRDLSSAEVAQHFKAGPQAQPGGPSLTEAKPNEHLFETKIAPLLANHCLECHDPATKEGKLDLSRKMTAFATEGVIMPGNAKDSLIWESVESDEMPEDRDPLSPEEKKVLREWIEGGAKWPEKIAMIDPANYVRDERAATPWVQRLTVPEYIETVRSAVGVDISEEARRLLPPDLRADGFSNTAYNLSVDLKHVTAYAELAEVVVERLDVRKFVEQFSKGRDLANDDKIAELIERMGKWLLRGPLTPEEVFTYRGVTTTVASAGGSFDEAMRYLVESMLQSPRFIYRIEKQRGDGTLWPVGDFELASRLSYILWGGPPDEALVEAAQKGALGNTGKLQAQVTRMLRDPRVVDRSLQFVSEWLDLGRLKNLQPDPKKFPNWDPALAADMRAETLAFFKEVAWEQKRPVTELLNAQVTFATPRLAQHYGLASIGKGNEPARHDLSSDPSRGGLLTHGSVLTIGGDEASMVTRGLFVFNDLLRGTVRNPPPDLDVSPVPSRPGLSHRNVSEQRIANVNCGGCHSKFEPLAFGLEKFDGLGSFHEKDEHGNPLREDGEILFPGAEKPVSYRTSAELMDLLAGSDRVAESLTWKIAQFSLGRPLTAEDVPFLKEIHETAQKNGGTYESLITAIVLSDLVRKTRTEAES